MTFRRILGLAAVLVAANTFAAAQETPAAETPVAATPAAATPAAAAPAATEPAAAGGVQVDAVAESAAAVASELTDAHGPAQPGNAEAGASKASACAACHSTDGNSVDPQYPKLAGQHERYIARHLALYKSGERENAIMLGFAAALSPQDMRDVGAYFASKIASPGMADDSLIAEGDNAGRKYYSVGETLFRSGDAERGIAACAACHGPVGRGNPGPSYPQLAGQHANYTATQLKAFRSGAVYGRGDNANAVMMGVAKYLTDEEIGSLASYIEGLHLAAPGTSSAP
ncbi:MAG: c-type cytochrome [Pseudomarimonas sp.]